MWANGRTSTSSSFIIKKICYIEYLLKNLGSGQSRCGFILILGNTMKFD